MPGLLKIIKETNTILHSARRINIQDGILMAFGLIPLFIYWCNEMRHPLAQLLLMETKPALSPVGVDAVVIPFLFFP